MFSFLTGKILFKKKILFHRRESHTLGKYFMLRESSFFKKKMPLKFFYGYLLMGVYDTFWMEATGDIYSKLSFFTPIFPLKSLWWRFFRDQKTRKNGRTVAKLSVRMSAVRKSWVRISHWLPPVDLLLTDVVSLCKINKFITERFIITWNCSSFVQGSSHR